MRSLISRTNPQIERKWFTIRILISLFSVVICLAAAGTGIYVFPAHWADVVWGSTFLAMFAFLVNMGIGAIISRRVRSLITTEYREKYAITRGDSPKTVDAVPVEEKIKVLMRGVRAGDITSKITIESCHPPEKFDTIDLGEVPEETVSTASGSLNTLDAIVGGMRVALGEPKTTVQTLRVVDEKPMSPSQRTQYGERHYDEDNSFDPLRRESKLARRVVEV